MRTLILGEYFKGPGRPPCEKILDQGPEQNVQHVMQISKEKSVICGK